MMVETSANLRMLAGSFASDPELLRSGSIAKHGRPLSHDAIAEIRALLPSALSPLVAGPRRSARGDNTARPAPRRTSRTTSP